MTREEREKAIKTLQKLQADYNDNYIDFEGANYAYNMAIEALQRCQEIDNKFANATNTDWVRKGYTDAEVKDICDDARKALQADLARDINVTTTDTISRQAILDKIREVCFSKKWREYRINNGSNGTRDYLISFIENMPPVHQTQKVGKWIRTKIRVSSGDFTNGVRCSACGYVTVVDDFKYCPNCGEKKVEPQESEEA